MRCCLFFTSAVISWHQIVRLIQQLGVFAFMAFMFSVCECKGDQNLGDLAEEMGKSHRALLTYPGGFRIDYRIGVEQNRDELNYIFADGLTGTVAVKWPQMKVRNHGKMHGISERDRHGKWKNTTDMCTREATYNFETKTGITVDDNRYAQVCNFRHAYTADSAHPLRWRFFVETSQDYFPGETHKTEYYLPNALQQHEYSITGHESINGAPCVVLRRGEIDTLWIATQHGHVVCKREFRYGDKVPLRERVTNADLREVADGIWVPFRQINEMFDKANTNKRLFRLDLTVVDFAIGNVPNNAVELTIPKEVRRVEDFVSNKVVSAYGNEEDRFDRAIQREEERSATALADRELRWIIILTALAALLGAKLFVAYRHSR